MRSTEDYNPITFEIVPTTQECAWLIMDWRNDPETLEQSFHSQPKTRPQFYEEFLDEYVLDAALPPVFALENGRRVGFLRFRRINDPGGKGAVSCDLSIIIERSQRGRGLSVPILKASLKFLQGRGIEKVLAEVKTGNIKSARAFTKAGFQSLGSFVHQTDGTSHQVERFIFNLVADFLLPGSQRAIGPGHPCFVIAEAGSNWRMGAPARDLKMAYTLIDVAGEAGADAVKFQTYRAETTYVENAGQSEYLSEAGISESIIDIFDDLSMPYEMLDDLHAYCQRQNILFMSTPFSVKDLQAVDPFVKLHKIASYELNHARLIEAAAATGKPLMFSTGASHLAEIAWSVNKFRSLSTAPVCLMQCTASYPAPLSALHLGVIPLMKSTFGVPVGLSDHSREPLAGPIAAVALGADLLEKHFTLDNRLPGPDHAFALTPAELKQMVGAIRSAEQCYGTGLKAVLPVEEELYWYARRGLQSIKDIKCGDKFIEGINFDILRPGKQKRGIHPKFIGVVASGRATRDIRYGEGIQEGDFN